MSIAVVSTTNEILKIFVTLQEAFFKIPVNCKYKWFSVHAFSFSPAKAHTSVTPSKQFQMWICLFLLCKVLTLHSLQVFIGFVLKQFEYIEVGQFRYEIRKDSLNSGSLQFLF